MVENIVLKEDETLILQENNASFLDGSSMRRSSIALTDRNLYFQLYYAFKSPDIQCIPLNSISFLAGDPLVYVRSEMKISHYLVITTRDRVYEFGLNSFARANAQRWVDCIKKCVIMNNNDNSHDFGGIEEKEPQDSSPDTFNDDRNNHKKEYDHALSIDVNIDSNSLEELSDYEISYDVVLDSDTVQVSDNDNKLVDLGYQSKGGSEQKKGFFADAFSNTLEKNMTQMVML